MNTGPLATIGGTGIFVTAVRAALLDGRVDVIVHSLQGPADRARRRASPSRPSRRGRTRSTRCAPGTG